MGVCKTKIGGGSEKRGKKRRKREEKGRKQGERRRKKTRGKGLILEVTGDKPHLNRCFPVTGKGGGGWMCKPPLSSEMGGLISKMRFLGDFFSFLSSPRRGHWVNEAEPAQGWPHLCGTA